MRIQTLFAAACILGCPLATDAQSVYFPPNFGGTWETTDPATLGWCADRIDSLYDFLGSRNTKAFLVLKDGRIVLEHYFGTFTQDSLWYWASAGKTLTSTLVGIAQEEGFLDIENPSSAYQGTGWTSELPPDEALITVRDQLTMTTGLDDAVPDNDCTDPACLQYAADAGTRWAYHNAPYTLLDDVVANSTGQSFPSYFNARIRNPIGMDGFWFPSGYNNVYASKARSMARYGLLALNNMVWGSDTILHDADYFNAAKSPSQTINNSYGYLWWLNGQPSFMVPGVQFVFPGSLMPSAPADMFSGLGKNDQVLNVVPSRGLVVVRMGNEAYTNDLVPIAFNNEIWEHIEWLDCSTSIAENSAKHQLSALPNPCSDRVWFTLPSSSADQAISVSDKLGRTVLTGRLYQPLDVVSLAPGCYNVRYWCDGELNSVRFIKQ